MYRNHRVHLLTPNREPSRHQNDPTVSHGPSRNIISQSQYLKATSQRYADFSRFLPIFHFIKHLESEQMVERGPSSSRAFFSWRSMKLHQTNRFIRCLCCSLLNVPFALCGVCVYYYIRNKKKSHARATLCAKPGNDVIYFCPFVCIVGIT